MQTSKSLDISFLGRVDGLFAMPIELGAILDELALGIVILDRSRQVLFINKAVEAMTGFRRDEVRGVPCRYVLRTNICGRQCPLTQAAQDRASVTTEGNIINRDRKKIDVRLLAAPLYDPQGAMVGFVETVEDMTHVQGDVTPVPKTDGFNRIIGRSDKMRELFQLVPVVAQTDSSLLITGETGTGKDLLAEAIHQVSDRSAGPFVKINCGALPETLLESELFGHKKGAFTGAVNAKMGRLKMAHQGSLYLTEIGDLPLALQVKLLTFLDDKIVYPLGSTDGFQADVRIIAATHRNLERMVSEGLFRQDLLFRLNVVRFHLPPLRERDDDAALLLDHFLKHYTARFDKRIRGYALPVRQFLATYRFPGNVRELRNIVEYAVSICTADQIGMDHLPAYLVDQKDQWDDAGVEAHSRPIAAHPFQKTAATLSWASIERQVIVDALLKAHGHKGKAAERLGWGRTTLWRKMKQYGLEK